MLRLIVVVVSEVVVVVECMSMHTTFGKWCRLVGKAVVVDVDAASAVTS